MPPPSRPPRRWPFQVLVVALAAAGLALPLPAGLVERWYARGFYPLLQRAVTPFSNRVPIALLDVLVAVAVLVVVAVVWRGIAAAIRARRPGPVLAAAWRLLVGASAVYLVFMAAWGLNYRRLPLAERLEMRAEPPTSQDVVNLGLEAVSRLNRLHAAAHAEGWPAEPWRTPELRRGFADLQALLGDPVPAVPGRLKPTVFGAYFRWTGVDGMVNPFGLETLGNPELLPFERPFVAAHEWAHLAGYADEAEASFVGWLACVRGGAPAEYSGWLALFVQVHAEAGQNGQAALMAVLDEGPREDLAAIAARQRRDQVPALRRAGREVYDSYLRANRVDDGVERYGAVVTLAAQAVFADGWTPTLRDLP